MTKHMKTGFTATVALLFAATGVFAVPVTPNPNSRLATKRVLLLDGNSTSHATTRTAATAKLNLIRTAIGFTMTTGTVANVTTAYLNNFDIVIFNYFFETQLAGATFQNAIKAWLATGGKGYVGYHTSGANEDNEWNWYRDSVTSMRYHVHSTAAQNGTINRTTDAAILADPIMQGLPASFTGIDEWYDFDYGLTWAACKTMYLLNEATLATPPQRPMNPHPMAWYREDSRLSRYFYTAIIHDISGVNSTTDFFHSLVLRGLEWVANYNITPIVNGKSITPKGIISMDLNRELQVDAGGKHSLKVWSPEGKLLYSIQDSEAKSHNVPAFAKPGLYIAKIESKDGVFTQRVMVQ